MIENIKAKAHFLVILSPSALERCHEPGDWLRREIETAMDEKRNIIPLMMEGFDFGSEATTQALTGKLAILKTYNGLPLIPFYFPAAMEALRTRYLNIALEDIPLHSLSHETKEINENNKSAANEAAPVETQQLTAEEWFERAYVFQKANNLEEALRCYSEALHLDPDIPEAYNDLGILFEDLERYEEAEHAFHKAIEVYPLYAVAYVNLGWLLHKYLN